MAALSLFYSYAHEDEALRDQLEKHLRQLQRQELISEWHDRKILPGGAWSDEIDTHLETASIILLLVSPDFLASDYCYENEMQRALERHKRGEARVIPIILRPCDWQHSPLRDLQCLPRDGKPVTQWQDQDEAFVTITQDLRKYIEKEKSPAHPLSPLDRQNRVRLLKRVRTIWIDGLLTQSLHHATAIELHLQDRPDVLDNPLRLQLQELNQAPQTLPDGTTILHMYDRAEGELLILGEPGAGKTTLLLELTRALLERAEQDERLPMPIVFNLSSWAEKRQSLRTWLVEELWMIYHVPRKIGKGWIDADQILPLLDGLDEVAKDARSACVEQINDYYQSRLERGSSPIVVCCRSEEYTALSTRVMLQHAVSVLPLTDEQITIYLEQVGEQVKGLRQVLSDDAELRQLARQPLMLNIFAFAYQGATAAEVPTGETRGGVQQTIFARYVEHMLKRRGQSKRWQPEQVIRWLAFLARQMRRHNQTVFSVENLQPSWLPRRWRVICQWCIVLIIGLVIGSIIGLVYKLLASSAYADSVFIDALGVYWFAFVKLIGKPAVELIFGLASSLSIGLTIGLLGWWRYFKLSGRQVPERLSLSPNEGIWHAGKNGLLVGLGFWLIIGLWLGRVYGLDFGLVHGLLCGSIAGLISGQAAFMGHFILRFFLWRRGDLPWDLIAFLDEAAQRLFLRKVGGSYIFVHRLLLDYFKDLAKKDK